jgi:hypothetical protein
MKQDEYVQINPELSWKNSVQQDEGCLHQQSGFNLRKNLVKWLHLEHSFLLR